MGCHRSSDEIGRWGQADAAGKRAILESCRNRRFQSSVAERQHER